MGNIKVLIVDDSKLIRYMVEEFLKNDPEITVVGSAQDAYEARDLIKQTNPDVITLDIMMPGMDGITFLKNLMRLHPLPVVMLSALTKKNSDIAMEALANGAVDYLEKPSPQDMKDPGKYIAKLVQIIKDAAQANIKIRPLGIFPKLDISPALLKTSDLLGDEIIAIGASTGGIEAIELLLPQLPRFFPPILITQHIRKEFSPVFLKRMSQLTRLQVEEAVDGMEIVPGKIYLAIAGFHLKIKEVDSKYYCALDESAPVNSHKPSVDVLFESVAKVYGKNSIGVLLTGMGSDGAKGLKSIREAGGNTIAQDEQTSVVWGMPGSAVKINAAEYVVPLTDVVGTLLLILDNKAKARAEASGKIFKQFNDGA